jgi:1-acyl-sn-glycerol-3-phosphate acyltransferase
MDRRIFSMPVLGWLFKLAKAIPIASRADDPLAYESALAAAQKVLKQGDLLAIFPEGGLTLDGKLQEFKGGIMRILEREPVPVIPMALNNLWGSYFSRVEGGNAMIRPFRRGMFSRVGLQVGTQLAPNDVRPEILQAHIAGLMTQA